VRELIAASTRSQAPASPESVIRTTLPKGSYSYVIVVDLPAAGCPSKKRRSVGKKVGKRPGGGFSPTHGLERTLGIEGSLPLTGEQVSTQKAAA
jgi:hypothetical protein